MPEADFGRNRRAPPPVEPRDHTLGKAVLVIGAIGALGLCGTHLQFSSHHATGPDHPQRSPDHPTDAR
jgi:hypothetical protein